MHRRAFFKAMGATGLLSFANWSTLIRGPEPGCTIYRGVIRKTTSVFLVAAEPLRAGTVVSVTNGLLRMATAATDHRVVGIALRDCGKDDVVEVVTSGIVERTHHGT